MEKKIKLFIPVLLLLFLTLPISLFAQEDASAFTERELQKLERGDVIVKPGYRAPGVDEEIGSQLAAIVRLKAPIQRVWDLLAAWESYEYIIPNVQELKLIEQKDNSFLLYFNLSLQVKNIEYYLNYYFYKEKNLVTFQLDRNKENDFRRFHGYFKFDPIEGEEEKVQIVYSVDVELGKYFPEFIKNYFAKKDLPKVIGNLKKLLEADKKDMEKALNPEN